MVAMAMVTGRVGADPRVKEWDKKRVQNFGLAVSDMNKSRDEEKTTEWYDVTVWGGRLGEYVEENVTKGCIVCVVGPMTQKVWKDKEGRPRTTVTVYAKEVTIIARRPSERRRSDPYESGPSMNPPPPEATGEDEIPF